MNHDVVEKNIGLMIAAVIVVISLGGLAEIVPLFFQQSLHTPIEGLTPLTAVQLEGRDLGLERWIQR